MIRYKDQFGVLAKIINQSSYKLTPFLAIIHRQIERLTMKVFIATLLLIAFVSPSFVVAAEEKTTPKETDVISVVGEGRYPPLRRKKPHKIVARQRLKARRGAIASGWRKLAERIEKLYTADGKELVDTFSKDGKAKVTVRNLVIGAKVVGKTKYTKEGAEVTLELPLAKVKTAFGLEKLFLKKQKQ